MVKHSQVPERGGMALRVHAMTFAGELFVLFGCDKGALLAQLANFLGKTESRAGGGAGSNSPWEISPGQQEHLTAS